MLLWRAISPRVAVSLRRNAVAPRRYIQNIQQPLYHYQRRGPGLASKIWFRADGTPRSKLKGAVFVGLATFSVLMTLAMADAVGDYDNINYVLTSLVYIQKVDTTYASMDLTTRDSARAYFYELCCTIPDTASSVVDDFFYEIDRVLRADGPHSTELCAIMKEAAEEVHELLAKLNKDNALFVGYDVLQALDKSILSIADVVQQFHGGEDGEKVFIQNFIKEDRGQDHSSKGSGYDAIG